MLIKFEFSFHKKDTLIIRLIVVKLNPVIHPVETLINDHGLTLYIKKVKI